MRSRSPVRVTERAVDRAAAFIERHQRVDGAIPSFRDGSLDPWDHVECAMALDVGGRHEAAAAAYAWVAAHQHVDGGLWSEYRSIRHGGVTPVTELRESHVASYVAVGAWHHYLITGDRDWLAAYWPVVRAAVNFALSMQVESGAVHWAVDATGRAWPDTLVAAAASVRAAVRCGEQAAHLLGEPEAATWPAHRRRLEDSFAREYAWGQTLPERGDRFSMHWYYPVLTGVVTGHEARERLEREWDRFIIDWHGCRCVADRPWVTIAESAELVLALHASGMEEEARDILRWQLDWQDSDGGFRMGTALNWGMWPDERPSWTAAAVVLAADALAERTPGATLFASLGKT